MTTDQKDDSAAVIHLFERFVDSGYDADKFTEKLYAVLRRSFGFIAHYDRRGFYVARFATASVRVSTFLTIVEPPAFVSTPLETAIRELVVARDLFAHAQRQFDHETETRERAELARLKAKYDPEVVDPLS